MKTTDASTSSVPPKTEKSSECATRQEAKILGARKWYSKTYEFFVSNIIAIGFVMILIAVVSAECIEPSSRAQADNAKLALADGVYVFVFAGIQFFAVLGVALVGMGAINIKKDSQSWQHYFEERLKNLIFDRAYLSQMNEFELFEIQKTVYRHLSQREDVDDKEGYLAHFNSSLIKYMVVPYREHLDTRIEILYYDESNNTVLIKSTVKYFCKKGKNGIQEKCSYQFDGEDIGRLYAVSISATLPHGKNDGNIIKGHCCLEPKELCYKTGKDRNETFFWRDHGEIKDILDKHNGNNSMEKKWCSELEKWPETKQDDDLLKRVTITHNGSTILFDFSLTDRKNCDGLSIEIISYKTVDINKLQIINMSFPTRYASLIITWRDRFEVEIAKIFVESDKYLLVDKGITLEGINYRSWLLPGEGFVYNIMSLQGK